MIEILIVAVCLGLNAVLAGTEIAFVVATRPSIRELSRQGDRKAQLLLHLRDQPERTLSVIQIGITLVAFVAGAVGGAGAEEWLSPWLEQYGALGEETADAVAIAIVVIPLTYASVVIGELVPKAVALRYALPIAVITAPWLAWLDRWLRPVVSVLERSTKGLLRLLFAGKSRADLPHADSTQTVELSQLSSQHQLYVVNLVALEQKRVREVLLPWNQVVTVDVSQSWQEVEDIVIHCRHTRLPVVHNRAVVGILNSKEFLSFRAVNQTNWGALIRKPITMPDTMPLLQGLKLLQERHMHMGIVYAQDILCGIVTLEDILEEIVGDIYDEDDDERLRRLVNATVKSRSFPAAATHRSSKP
jgi:putative hemolysin